MKALLLPIGLFIFLVCIVTSFSASVLALTTVLTAGPGVKEIDLELFQEPRHWLRPQVLTVVAIYAFLHISLMAASTISGIRLGRILGTWVLGLLLLPLIAIGGLFLMGMTHRVINLEPARYLSLTLMSLLTTGVLAFTTWFPLRGPRKAKESLRGRTIVSHKEATKRANAMRPKDDDGLAWGGLKLARDSYKLHFCAAGTSRSGKTVMLRLLMQSVLAGSRLDAGTRALIYDPKREFRPILTGMGIPQQRIKIANPLDLDAARWRVAEDIRTPVDAIALTKLLIPDSNEREKYFTRAAQRLTQAVIETLMITAPGNWTLRDVISIVLDDKPLKRVLSWSHEGKRVFRRYCLGAKSYGDIRPTLDNCLDPYRVVASLWDHATESFSIDEWSRSDGILLMGIDDSISDSLLPIYRVLFTFAWQRLSALPKTEVPHTWVVVDEAQDAGELPAIRPLLRKGAGHGVRLVLAFQDYSGMCEVYGPHGADHLTGLCGLKALFRTDSPPTAQWAATHLGRAEVVDQAKSQSVGDQGTTRSTSEQVRDRFAVYPDELMELDAPGPDGVHGYFVVPGIGSYRATVPLTDLMLPVGEEIRRRTDPLEQYLKRLSAEDWARLSASAARVATSEELEPPFPSEPIAVSGRSSPLDTLSRIRLRTA